METTTATRHSLHLLKNAFARKKTRNPAYSLRALARDLGLSPAYLSLVFQGRKRLTLKRALDVSGVLRMEESERQTYLRAVALESLQRGGGDASGQVSEASVEALMGSKSLPTGDPLAAYSIMGLDRFRLLTDWYHVPLLDLTTTVDAQGDVGWISRRLGIGRAEAQEALERLVRLGLVEKRRGKWVKTHQTIFFPTDRSDPSVREFHRQMLRKALDELERVDDRHYRARRIVAATIAVDPAKIEQASLLIQEFQDRLAALAGSGTPREVYQLGVQFFPLTRTTDS